MDFLTDQPVLGHITTFGGHPVCCAAGLASFKALQEENLISEIRAKESLFLSLLKHPSIRSVRSFGLWIAVEFEDFEFCKKVIDHCIEHGVLTDWFLFAPNCLRISPPLTITEEQIKRSCEVILKALQ